MAWVQITTGSLQTILSAAEYNKFSTSLTGFIVSAPDILASEIQEVTDLVRGYVAGSYKNELESDITLIPRSLLRPALSILAVRLGERLGGKIVDINGRRDQAYKDAITLLEQVAAGRFATEKPANPLIPYAEKDTVVASADNSPLLY